MWVTFLCVILIVETFETSAILQEFRHFTDVFLLPFQLYSLKEILCFKRQMCYVNNSGKEHTCFEILFKKYVLIWNAKSSRESSVSRKTEITAGF